MFRLTLRNLFARKVRLLMSGLAVVLGVAFLAGVLVFSNGLSTTFDGIVNGSTPDGVVRADTQQDPTNGMVTSGTAALRPQVVDDLEALPEVASADGDVVGLGMNLLAKDGTLVGGTGAPTLSFNYYDGDNMAGEPILELDSGRWPEADDEIVLDSGAAANGDYRIGDEVRLLAPFGQVAQTATMVGTAEFNGGGTGGATLLLFTTHRAQELFLDGRDAFSQISLTAADGVTQQELVDAAATVTPTGFEAVTGDQVAEEQQDAFGAFLDVIKVFLLVFAIIAVIVGGFIIVNTFAILVAQRTRESALLRALGASRGQVTRSVLVEAFVLAVVASTAGILLGLALARGLAAIFSAVGLDIAGSALQLTAGAVVTSYLVGIVVTMIAAFLPARRAGKVAPLAAMRIDAATPRGSLRRRALVGCVLLALGAGFAAAGVVGAPGSDAAWVGVGAVVWILTLAVISPIVGRPVLLGIRAVFGRLFGTSGRLAGENALRDPRRTGATASALMIGLALVSTIGVLAASMNESVDDIVDEEFTADFLVQSTNFLPFSTEVGDALAQVDGVGTLTRQQWVAAQYDGGTVGVAGNDEAFTDVYTPEVVAGTVDAAGAEAVVDSDFATEHGLSVGDPLELAFPAADTITVDVVGIVEPSETSAQVSIPLDELTSAGVARQDTSISIDATPGADVEAVHQALDDAASVVPIVAVYDKAEFAEEIRGQVNQLLYLIYGLLALAIVIAVIGIVNTLGLSVIERTREIGLLRAIGMSRARLRRMITLESVAIAVLGAVLGMALGLVIGTLLRETLRDDLTSLGLPLGQLVAFLLIAIAVGVLAAVVPAIRAARLNVLAAIATE